MDNCYLKELNAVVNKENLDFYGDIILRTSKLSQSDYTPNTVAKLDITARYSKTVTVTALDGGYFGTDPSTIDTERLTSITNNHVVIYFCNDSYRVRISGRYNNIIQAYNSQVNGSSLSKSLFVPQKLFDFKYIADNTFTSLQGRFVGKTSDIIDLYPLIDANLNFNGSTELSVNLADFSNATRVKKLLLNNIQNINGGITSLAKCTMLNEITMDKAGNHGSVEDFVAAQISEGRSTVTESSPINWTYIFRNLSFGNAPSTSSYSFLTWESATKIAIFEGNSSLVSCTNVYCKGYTQEEASAKWPGKTIIRVDEES